MIKQLSQHETCFIQHAATLQEALSGHGRKEQAVKGKGKERRKLASVVAKEEALAKQVEEYNVCRDI